MASERISRGLAKRTAVPAALRMVVRIGLGGFAESYDEQARGGESFGGMQKQSLVGFGLEFSGARGRSSRLF